MEEIWKLVPGAPLEVWASSKGRVRRWYDRRKCWCYSHQWVTKAGYLRVSFRLKNLKWGATVHSLVASAFHGARPERAQCRHLNGDKRDNIPGNLKWGTTRENCADSKRLGRVSHRTIKRRAILREDLAIELRNAEGLRCAQQ